MKCPKCGREFDELLALSREDNETKICDECGVSEAIEAFRRSDTMLGRRMTPYEKTRNMVYTTGNRWAIENFEATHS